MKWVIAFMWQYSRLLGNALTALGLLGLLACVVSWIRIYSDWAERVMSK